jgi:hypothetical protein
MNFFWMNTPHAHARLREHINVKQRALGGGGANYIFRSRDGFTCAYAEGRLLSTDDGFSAVVGASRVRDGSGRLLRTMYWVERRPARSSKR